ncbi:MAG: PAS domain-containing sensor histidine kinase, partial [Candidatus Eremiobacterota bacterium]
MGETKQDRYERICNELSDIIIVIEPKSREIIWVNSAVKHILGYEKNDLTGKNYSSLLPDEGSHIKDLDKINIYDAVIEEQEFVRSDGSICAMDVTAGMINWTDEQIAIVITLRDITERKLMREELEKTRKEFIAILTHDLKNPLGAIMNFIELLEGDLQEKDKCECINMIRYSGDIMLNLINNIVGSSRIESGKMTYNFHDFLLEDLLQEMRKTFMPAAAEKEITLNFTCKKGTVIYGDREKIRQIFQNFISNALRYTKKGFINIISSHKGDRVNLEVSDTGCG